ncbi:MlaE family ABC transporter permease [Candidatus Omnitrophota bacterium]
MFGLLIKLGKKVEYGLRFTGQIFFFTIEAFTLIVKGKIRWRDTIRQIYEIGVEAFPIISIASLATGMVMAVQAAVILARFGARQYIANFVGLALVRELSPVLGSIIFVGKSGAKISAEIGSMSVNEQLLATRTLGIDPMYFFTTSRLLACMIALPILVCWSGIIGILGGLVISAIQENIPMQSYLDYTFRSLRVVDFAGGMIKTCFFSVIIGIVCCFKGFQTRGGSTGVGRYTTEAVALSTILIIISNFILTKLILTVWG